MAKRQNLTIYSEQFDNAAWSSSNVTITANAAVAPDGTATADLMYPTTTGTLRRVSRVSFTLAAPIQPVTVSVYAKASGKTWLSFFNLQAGAVVAWFDLTNGVIGTVTGGNGITYTARIESVGNGWYRCSMTQNAPAVGSCYASALVSDSDGITTATTNGTDGILIWGAQVVPANHPGPYTPTTTVPVNTGNIRNIAQKKQNLFPNSESVGTVFSSQTNCSISADVAAAPNGTLTADAIVSTSLAAVNHTCSAADPLLGIGVIRTFSCYAKAGAVSWLALAIEAGAKAAYFQLTGSGAVGTVSAGSSATIESIGGGWYRCTLTALHTAYTAAGVRILPANADGGASYAAADIVAAQTYVWGVQIVNASCAGPYTRTTTAAIDTGNIRNSTQKKQNLLLQSQAFNTTWTKTNTTVSADAGTAPDGTLTADLVYPTTTGADRYVTQLVTGLGNAGVTVSVYAKASGKSWIYLDNLVGNVRAAWFDLTNGVVGTVVGGNGVTYVARIEAVGNGWYRCSLFEYRVPFAATYFGCLVAVADADNSATATTNGTDGVLLWGAQTVIDNDPGPYVPTTTVAINTGNIR